MRVLVTGHRGYIGAQLVDVLKQSGHWVTGCDLGLFRGCEWDAPTPPDRELSKDVRALSLDDLQGHDGVMHLAAISNDPMGELDPELTLGVNGGASVRLASLAKRAGVPRFLFSGSCSVYGRGDRLDLDEEASLQPLTVYARSKLDAEAAISKLADDDFSPTFLRNATAYGYSPMLRVDLVVNNLLGTVLSYGEIRLTSDGTSWRPLIHCRDIARAFLAFLEAPLDRVRDRVVNVGANEENFQVREVAERIQRLVPGADITFTGEAGPDPRNYRVNFDRLRSLLPDFRIEHPLASGMEDLHRRMVERGFGVREFEGDRFVRLRTLRKRLDLLQAARASEVPA